MDLTFPVTSVIAVAFALLSLTVILLLRLRKANRSLSKALDTFRDEACDQLADCEDDLSGARHEAAALRATLNAMPLPLACFEADGRLSFANQCLRDIAEIDPVGMHFESLFEGEIGGVGELLVAGRESGPFSLQAKMSRRLGGRPAIVTLAPRPDEPGMVAVFVDDGERRVTEDRLKRSEAMTGAILDAAVDGIITIDERGRIEVFNRAAEKIFGYGAGEVKGSSLNILMPAGLRTEHDSYVRRYLATGQQRIIGRGREVEGQRKDGGVFPMDLAVGESEVAGRRIFAGIIRDVTERRAMERQLRESEEQFRLLVEGVSDYAISILDIDGTVKSWNRGGERIDGWAPADIIGRHFSCLYPPDAVAQGAPERALAMLREHGRLAEEGWRLRKDGTPYWAHILLSTIRDESGTVRGIARISRDMSQQKRAADDLRRAMDEAEKAREAAERADRAKSQFLAAASHDLRQPVQALLFFTSAMAGHLQGHPAQPMLAEMDKSVEALNTLLTSLLDISRLDAGVVKPDLTTFPVANLLTRLEAEFAPLAKAKGLSLKVRPSNATINSDSTLLGRIVQNLMANAVRYTREGRVVVGCRRRGNHLRIEIWDTGIGIPAHRTGEIFKEFSQLGEPDHDRGQGLGLGLAIVDRLARLLGHAVTVRSRVGRGSVFAIEVPLAAQAPLSDCPKKDADDDEGCSPLVVVIDDEAAILKGLKMVLEGWNYQVLTAGSQEEAMRLLARCQQCPHAIVADYRLRDGRTGTEAIRGIRDHFGKSIPSIVITGDTAPERLREAEASGFHILHKPVPVPLLRRLLSERTRPGDAEILVDPHPSKTG